MAPSDRARAAIVADDVAATYGRRLIWRGASFTIEPGEFIVVLGPAVIQLLSKLK